jgi:hypothetical protein
LQAELARDTAEWNWEIAQALPGAICVFSKGRGKSKGKSNPGKGGYSGNSGTSGSEGGGKHGCSNGGYGGKGAFEGTCHHCGTWGHRRSECNKVDAEMPMKSGRGSIEKGGGNGGMYIVERAD